MVAAVVAAAVVLEATSAPMGKEADAFASGTSAVRAAEPKVASSVGLKAVETVGAGLVLVLVEAGAMAGAL